MVYLNDYMERVHDGTLTIEEAYRLYELGFATICDDGNATKIKREE